MADNHKTDEDLSKTVKSSSNKFNSNKETHLYYSSPVERLSNLIDSHLLEARLFTVSLVGVGLVIIGRSIRIGAKFSRVKEIPEGFVRRHVCLRGVVESMDSNNGPILYINHIPIIKFSWLKSDANGHLPVSLYGVITQPSGVDWLKSNCMNREVWFQLMSTNDKNFLDCVISLRKSWLVKTCVNEFLVKNGLARVQQINSTSLDPASVRFLNRFLKAEAKACSKGKGMWKEKKQPEYSSTISKSLYFVQQFCTRLMRKCRNIISYYSKRK